MPYVLPIVLAREGFEHYAVVDKAFTKEECEKIIEIGKQTWEAAVVASGINTELRRSKVAWIDWKPDHDWLFAKLARMVTEVNAKYFGYDISSFSEPLQLTRYESEDAGHYGWHQDIGANMMSIRKVSFVLQLTDGAEYTGGDLELFMAERDGHQKVPREQGSLIIFPSFEVHRVTEMTSGCRHSLVGWTSGPPLR